MPRVKYQFDSDAIPNLSEKERKVYKEISEKFIFRTNDYYNKLINWEDPDDPLRKLIVPDEAELHDWGQIDASSERLYQPVQGVEHKYKDTVLLLCNDVCAAYCRFCFRKRLFQPDNDEVVKDTSLGIDYIRNHTEVTNVLLTGGDPLIMSTPRLEKIISAICDVPHIRNIRIGTKVPAFNPFRILDDPTLALMFEKYGRHKQINLMVHFNHPKELTEQAIESLRKLKPFSTILNQTPIIRGVNDNSNILAKLFEELSFLGIQPYYVFACRPTEGNKSFSLPIERAFQIFEEARKIGSGLARTARFMMSHTSGKIEVVAITERHSVFRFHNMVKPELNGQIQISPNNPQAYWFDEFKCVEMDIEA